MKFGKNANIRGNWQWVQLEKEEIEEALDELLEYNNKFMEKCLTKTSSETMASALFEKNGIASYTYLTQVLEQKIAKLKQKNFFNKNAKNNKTENKPQKDDGKKSLLDEAINSTGGY